VLFASQTKHVWCLWLTYCVLSEFFRRFCLCGEIAAGEVLHKHLRILTGFCKNGSCKTKTCWKM